MIEGKMSAYSADEKFYTVPELAELLNRSEGTIRKHYVKGHLVGYKKMNRIYFMHSDVVRFLVGKIAMADSMVYGKKEK